MSFSRDITFQNNLDKLKRGNVRNQSINIQSQ